MTFNHHQCSKPITIIILNVQAEGSKAGDFSGSSMPTLAACIGQLVCTDTTGHRWAPTTCCSPLSTAFQLHISTHHSSHNSFSLNSRDMDSSLYPCLGFLIKCLQLLVDLVRNWWINKAWPCLVSLPQRLRIYPCHTWTSLGPWRGQRNPTCNGHTSASTAVLCRRWLVVCNDKQHHLHPQFNRMIYRALGEQKGCKHTSQAPLG